MRKITENIVLVDQYPNMEIEVVFKVFENSLFLKHYLTLALSMALMYSGIQTRAILLPCSAVKTENGDIIVDPTMEQWDTSVSKMFL
mmetsp:Transcript_3527/g.4317  ORF Transcript_3527/g.4317 Transcript_3527/m.4317 type:complete len:87 (+) Transcript_3527:229-489(+)